MLFNHSQYIFQFQSFQPIDESRSIELDGHIIKMPKGLYVVMLHFNEYPAYKLDYFDSKFVSVLAASYIRVDEVKNGLIEADDIRMKLCLGKFSTFCM